MSPTPGGGRFTATGAELDAVASACGFLANLFLRKEAGPAVVANLTPETAAAWPMAELLTEPAPGATLDLAQVRADTEEGIALLVSAVEGSASDEDLVADYTRLFVGPGTMAACPWESVHRSEEGLTFEAETLQVRRFYAEAGLQAPALNREPDDHIGLELAFVGELAVAALDARAGGDMQGYAFALDIAERFMTEHIGMWAGNFAELVKNNATTDLFRASGLLLQGALPVMSYVFLSN